MAIFLIVTCGLWLLFVLLALACGEAAPLGLTLVAGLFFAFIAGAAAAASWGWALFGGAQ